MDNLLVAALSQKEGVLPLSSPFLLRTRHFTGPSVTLSVEKNDLDVSTGVNEDVERSTTPREDSEKVNSLS